MYEAIFLVKIYMYMCMYALRECVRVGRGLGEDIMLKGASERHRKLPVLRARDRSYTNLFK